LAESYDGAGRRDDALKLRAEVVAVRRKVLGPEHPSTLHAMQDLTHSYDETGRQDEALKLRRELLTLCLKTTENANSTTLNNLAWTLATSKAAEMRDGTNAVRLAEKAVYATHRKDALCLDTLAAAYAETQQFDKAVTTQQEAIGLLQSEQDKKDYTARLKLYQSNRPYRKP
jgi:tetratricopeptide (TPR) repeat protein